MNCKFLVVDDDKEFLRQLRATFADQGYWVVSAQNGEEAIEELKKTEMDLVVLDIQMPGISGLEVLKHVKKNYPETLVVMLTGYGEYKEEAESLGCDGFLEKPITFKALTDAVLSILKRKDYNEVKELSLQDKFIQAKKGDIIADIILLGVKNYYADIVSSSFEKRPNAYFKVHVPVDAQQAWAFQEIFYAEIILVERLTFKEPKKAIEKIQAADKPPKAYIFYPKDKVNDDKEIQVLVKGDNAKVWDPKGYGRSELDELFELVSAIALEHGCVKK